MRFRPLAKNHPLAFPRSAPKAFAGVRAELRSVNHEDLESAPAEFTSASEINLSRRRFDVILSGVRYECFASPHEGPNLYVFLSSLGSAARRDRDGNIRASFDRVSWHQSMPGTCLNIDDPMWREHNLTLPVTWYYGTETRSYLVDVAKIVAAVARRQGIRNRNIILIGSSAGGYASLYLADLLEGATAFAVAPQFVPRIYAGREAANEYRDRGVDLWGADDPHRRTDLSHLWRNPKSRFIVFLSSNSPSDYDEQLVPFCGTARGGELSHGLNVFGNIYLCIGHFESLTEHLGWIDQDQARLILDILDNVSDRTVMVNMVNSVLEIANTEHSMRTSLLSPDEIDAIRDAAVRLERVDLHHARALMEIAAKLRPNGDFILRKAHEYAERLRVLSTR